VIEAKPFVEVYETPPELVGRRNPLKSRFVVKHGDFEPEVKRTKKSKKTTEVDPIRGTRDRWN